MNINETVNLLNAFSKRIKMIKAYKKMAYQIPDRNPAGGKIDEESDQCGVWISL